MKSTNHSNEIFRSFILLIIYFHFFYESSYSQTTTPLAKIDSTGSEINQWDLGHINLLGIGDEFKPFIGLKPSAKFHIRDYLSDQPVFMTEIKNSSNESLGSLKYLFHTESDSIFGIYQSGSNINNYFHGPMIDLSGFYTSSGYNCMGPGSGIAGIACNPLRINIRISPSGQEETILEIYFRNKVKINDTLECADFLLPTRAGIGKVLVSDVKGNGTWKAVSDLDDKKWLINRFDDMISYPGQKFIGLGFQNEREKVLQQLHIVDGNILLSKLHGGNHGSDNGGIFFGDKNVDEDHPFGQWCIEYYNEGLNFRKVGDITPGGNTAGEPEPNYRLFLRNDGAVGIGTQNTHGFKLAVLGNILCEELKIRKYQRWPDYVFSDDYKLMSPRELENFIRLHHHLPDMPDLTEVNDKGISVGEMNCILIRKIEELTRYILDLQRQVDELKSAHDSN